MSRLGTNRDTSAPERSRGGWSRVRRMRRGLAWAAGGYGVLALGGALLSPTHEWFPFFCWFLFPLTPGHESRWEVEVLSRAGHELAAPVPFFPSPALAGSRAVDAYYAIQTLGHARRQRSASEAERARRVFESAFMSPPCRYRLLHRELDALAALRRERVPSPTSSEELTCGPSLTSRRPGRPEGP